MPPPEPPIVNEGRMTVGKPSICCTCKASSMLCAITERAEAKPMRVMACLNFSRSSAMSMASRDAPIISTPYFSSTPCLAKSSAQFSAVCPPIVGRIASGFSLAIIFSTMRQVIGSIYVASAMLGSVMMVAGLEFTRMTR